MVLLDHNPTTGVSTYYKTGEDGQFHIVKQYDREPLTKVCAEERAATSGERFGDMRRVARIPHAELGELLRDGKLFDQNYMRKWIAERPHLKTFDKTW